MDKKVTVVGELHQDLTYQSNAFSELISLLSKELNSLNYAKLSPSQLESIIKETIQKSPKKNNSLARISRGGNGNNSAELFCRLHIPVDLMSTIGNNSKWMIEELNNIGIGTSSVIQQNTPTPISTIIEDKNITKIFIAGNLKDQLDYSTLRFSQNSLNDSIIVFFTPISPKFQKIYSEINANNSIVAITIELQKISSLSQLDFVKEKKADLLFANLSDLYNIIKYDQILLKNLSLDSPNELIEVIDQIFQNYSKVRIYTQGNLGSTIISDDNKIQLPIIEVEVKNRTGAGDTYAAAFLSEMFHLFHSKQDFLISIKENFFNVINKCGKYANVAAALKISSGFAPTALDVQNYINKLNEEL